MAVGALLVISLFAIPAQALDRRTILDAIRQVESGGRTGVIVGDAGKAIGPYQIHRVYWEDAVLFDAELAEEPYDYQSCHDAEYAEKVIAAYMQRWAPRAWRVGDAETIARVHNGGPRGADKRATDNYWERVEKELRRRID